jgi:hypothetical protein
MWQTELVIMIRYLLMDIDSSNYEFSDARLQECILVAAQLIKAEIDLIVKYSVDVDQVILSPDPTEDPKDDAFINLLILKTACILDMGQARKSAGKSIKVTDGRSSIDMGKRFEAYKALMEIGACKAYEQAKLEYILGHNNPGEAILGPLKSPNLLFYNQEYRER